MRRFMCIEFIKYSDGLYSAIYYPSLVEIAIIIRNINNQGVISKKAGDVVLLYRCVRSKHIPSRFRW